MRTLLLIVSMMLLCACQTRPTGAPGESAEQAARTDEGAETCRRVKVTGSRMARNVCRGD